MQHGMTFFGHMLNSRGEWRIPISKKQQTIIANHFMSLKSDGKKYIIHILWCATCLEVAKYLFAKSINTKSLLHYGEPIRETFFLVSGLETNKFVPVSCTPSIFKFINLQHLHVLATPITIAF